LFLDKSWGRAKRDMSGDVRCPPPIIWFFYF
jgi:hypothetical protein